MKALMLDWGACWTHFLELEQNYKKKKKYKDEEKRFFLTTIIAFIIGLNDEIGV